MWLPDLADAARVTRCSPVTPTALGLPATVARRAARRRPAHPPAPAGVAAVPRLGDVRRRRRAAGTPVQLYLKGFPDRATSRGRWRQDRTTRPDGRSQPPGRGRPRRVAVPRGPAAPAALPDLLTPGLRPTSCRRAVADAARARSDDGLRGDGGALPAGGERRRCASRGVGTDGARPSSPSTSPAAGRASMAARHEALWAPTGPRAAAAGRRAARPPTRTAACCGPVGCRACR